MGRKMVIRKLLIIFIMIIAVGCSATTVKQNKKPAMSKLPQVQPLLPPPPPAFKAPVIIEDPLADVQITLDAVEETLSSILYMIASEAGLNLIISPDINVKKPFTITVNNMPARDVLEVISENTGVYYEIKGNALKIVSSVTKTFKFPYVRMTTTQSSEIGGDVFGSAEANLRGDYSLKYDNPAESSDVQGQIIGSIHSIIFPSQATQAAAGETGEGSSASAGTTSSGNGFFRGSEGYIYNRFTGILKVTTTPSKMRMVESYMTDVLNELDKQVLIEAKLVEVTLNDSNEYGINWNGIFSGKIGGESFAGSLTGGFTPLATGFVGEIASNSASGLLSIIASTADVESVGNPSIRLMNGQSAMISSGQLIPYWELDRETDTETNQTTVSYNRVTVLDGIVLGVTAHVKENNTITLNIVPVFSDVRSEKVQYNEAGEIVASYPVVNLKEAGTVLNVKNGSTIIMGGLISNEEREEESKVPGLGDIPVLGYLFKHKKTVVEKSELVIFLTATIIDG